MSNIIPFPFHRTRAPTPDTSGEGEPPRGMMTDCSHRDVHKTLTLILNDYTDAHSAVLVADKIIHFIGVHQPESIVLSGAPTLFFRLRMSANIFFSTGRKYPDIFLQKIEEHLLKYPPS